MEKQSQPDQTLLRSRLEFPVWHVSFARCYAAWTNAPSDLKGPLLLSGQALTKAESWLLACPERLSDSEKRFIVRSISQRSKEPQHKPSAKRPATIQLRTKWRRQSDRSLWQLYAVIVVGLWFFAPDVMKDMMTHALNDPEAVRAIERQKRIAAMPDPKHAKGQAAPVLEEGSGDAVKVDPPQIKAIDPVAPAQPIPPPQNRTARLLDLAREQLDAGQRRRGLLLAIEAAELSSTEAEASGRHPAMASAVLTRSMGSRIQLAALATGGRPAVTALFCNGAKGLVATTADGTLSAWTSHSAGRRANLGAWHGPLNGVSVDRDCRRMMTVDEDFNAEIRPLDGGKPIAVLTGHEGTILASAFSPDGNNIATASQDSHARLWDARTGRLRAVLSGHDWQVNSIAFSNDGGSVVTASSDMTARIWDVASGRQLHVLGRHKGIVTSAAFSADGALVLTASWDGIARLWDSASGTLVRALKGGGGGIRSASLSSDGRRMLAIGDNAAVQLWDAQTGTEIAGHNAGVQKTRSAVFSPDGQWFSTLGWDGKASLHDAKTGDVVGSLSATEDRAQALIFGQGSTSAVTITEAGAQVTWPIFGTLQEGLRQAKAIAPSCLTVDERTLLGLEAEQPAWCKDLPTRGAVLPR